jgi:ribosome biogenesis GTPase
MTLESLGYTTNFEDYRQANNLGSFGVGRVILEHKERYIVKTETQEYDAEIIGNLRFSAQSRADFPAVGDWVAISSYDEDKALIHAVFPRISVIERQSVGKQGDKQIIAVNIDSAFIIQAVNRDFSINRIERYLTICNTSHISPIIVLNKIDLLSHPEVEALKRNIKERIPNIPIFVISNKTEQGIEAIKAVLQQGQTYCLLGSSGVGKSTLLNTLMETQAMRTDAISQSTDRGKHVTTHRELKVLESGGIIIDNPGMREVGITDVTGGLEVTFNAISELSKHCRYSDCTHTSEPGCAILNAVKNEEINKSSYENFLRMQREKEHFKTTVAERRKKDKDFGKMKKRFKKD